MPIPTGGEKSVQPFINTPAQSEGPSALKRILEEQKHTPPTPGGTPVEATSPGSTPPFVKEEVLTETDKKVMQGINAQSTFVKPDESGRDALKRLANKLENM